MKIVIDIPRVVFNDVKKTYEGNDTLYCGVKYGTPLPTGHWIKDGESTYPYKCDSCGAYHRALYDYCPSCGSYNGGDTDADSD